MPHSLSRSANRFKGKRITLEIEPRPICMHCGMPMKVEARSYPRLVVGLDENYELVDTYYRCGKFQCLGNQEPTVQPLNPHVGAKLEYDFAVLIKIVEFRWKHALTYEKIVEKKKKDWIVSDWIGSGDFLFLPSRRDAPQPCHARSASREITIPSSYLLLKSR